MGCILWVPTDSEAFYYSSCGRIFKCSDAVITDILIAGSTQKTMGDTDTEQG